MDITSFNILFFTSHIMPFMTFSDYTKLLLINKAFNTYFNNPIFSSINKAISTTTALHYINGLTLTKTLIPHTDPDIKNIIPYKGITITMYDGDLKHGWERQYRNDGTPILYSMYRNGKKNGIDIKYNDYCSGDGKYNIHSLFTYRDDVKDGRYSYYSVDGKLLEEGVYVDGKLEGTVYNYGNPTITTEYRNDKPHGLYTQRYTSYDGDTNAIYTEYVDGVKHGMNRVYYNNVLMVEERFENGNMKMAKDYNRDGTWRVKYF